MSCVLELNSIWKIYPHQAGNVVALQEIDLQVFEKDFLALMGPSGSGKSTLMHIMGCLDQPSRGILKIAGESVSRADDDLRSKFRAQKMGFVFQSFHLIPQLTVLDNVSLPLQYRLRGTDEQAKESLNRVGLSHRMDHFPSQLSGGERQRVAIARALMGDPLIIFADEPTGNLDSETGESIIGLFEMLNRDGKTIVMVTHDLTIAKRCHRIVDMKDGRLCGP